VDIQDIISSGLLELYAAGLTSNEESAQVQAWVKQYPEVAAELKAIELGLEEYAQANAVAPGAGVKDKLFATINTDAAAPVIDIKAEEKTTAKVYSISPAWKYAAAASVILLLGSVIFNILFYNKYNSANKELVSTQTELQQQKDMADAMKKDIDLMGDKNAKPFILAGMPDVADAEARIYWMKNNGDVYIDPSNLPEAPKGKQYQFWAIVDGVPVSGGMIDTKIEIDGKKVHFQKMKSFGKAQAFAVSLEDAGPEKPAPTKVMAMSKI
jgi:anti-sigma-K factor RskA